MKCTLMHQRKAVAQMELDDSTGLILKISEVYDAAHLPVGVPCKRGVADRAALNEWWADRSIPASRLGVKDALELLKLSTTKVLLARCFGLSLSDQYWIKPQDAGIAWEDVNFFENPFSEDIGDALFGVQKKMDGFDFSSPDNTSDGYLKKRWKLICGKRCLVKGGSDLARQQPFNEVIATKIMERLEIPCVKYELIFENGDPYSVCEDFVTKKTELVSAWRILQTQKKPNNVSVYSHFVACCQALGVTEIVKSLDQMIVLDYIIANEDRHLNNFGLLRDAQSLEWLGFAPIYDSGSSLGYDKVASQIKAQTGISCKPFKKTHEDQIKLVSDFSWLDFERLSDVETIIFETMAVEEAQELIDTRRIEAVAQSVRQRIEALKRIAAEHTAFADTTDGDVEENVAQDYTPKM